MPELPEVETIARGLASGADNLIGRRVVRAHVAWQRTVAKPEPALSEANGAAEFERRIVGQTVKAVGRRGKFVRIELDKDALLIHLRMSGDLLTGYSDEPLGSHSRLQIYFEDGLQLSFQDPRKFGRAWLVAEAAEVTGELGTEPLDSALTSSRFHKMLAARKRQLKPLLLDQTFLAGIGNIYADEALWAARIHYGQPTDALTRPRARALLAEVRTVLTKALAEGGTSFDAQYRGVNGESGYFSQSLNAYGQQGRPCPRCGRPIVREQFMNRGSHFCPHCQRIR